MSVSWSVVSCGASEASSGRGASSVASVCEALASFASEACFLRAARLRSERVIPARKRRPKREAMTAVIASSQPARMRTVTVRESSRT